jgi:hypothetical protein
MLTLIGSQLDSLGQDSDLISEHISTIVNSQQHSHLAHPDQFKMAVVPRFLSQRRSVKLLEQQASELAAQEQLYLN